MVRSFFVRTFDAVDLLLFDLDGLLVDTEKLHWKAYQMMCQKFGCTLEWDYPLYLSIAGGSAHGIHKRLLQELPQLFEGRSWEELYSVKKESLFHLLSSSPIPLMAGVEEALSTLVPLNVPMVVVTHSPKHVVEIVQASNPIFSVITRWICREMYSQPKPSPDGYLVACQDLHIRPEKAIGFEDTLRGIASLTAAGCRPVFVNANDTSGKEFCRQQGVTVLSSMAEVPSFFES